MDVRRAGRHAGFRYAAHALRPEVSVDETPPVRVYAASETATEREGSACFALRHSWERVHQSLWFKNRNITPKSNNRLREKTKPCR